jgi:hypothetical protein
MKSDHYVMLRATPSTELHTRTVIGVADWATHHVRSSAAANAGQTAIEEPAITVPHGVRQRTLGNGVEATEFRSIGSSLPCSSLAVDVIRLLRLR